ncbi:MAG: TetR/AcrR family transcriptional regulator [Armatimonadaceae bacterium]
MSKAEKTRERILETALHLFNENGSHRTTTNHIAETMGISPGNLYYHFRNKEEVIRGLLDRLVERWAEIFALPEDRSPTLDDLDRMLSQNFEVLYEYRFFYRERQALADRDPELAAQYQEVRRLGHLRCQQLIEQFMTNGVLKVPDSPEECQRLGVVTWLIGDFWLASLDLDGLPITPERLKKGVELVYTALRAYL